MRRSYQVAERKDSQALSEFLASEGQLLLPMVQLIEDAELAVDEVIDLANDGPGHPRPRAASTAAASGPAPDGSRSRRTRPSSHPSPPE